MKIPKENRKDIKSVKRTMEKSSVFPKAKMKHLAHETAEGMKKHHRMKAHKASKEELNEAHVHMKKHGG